MLCRNGCSNLQRDYFMRRETKINDGCELFARVLKINASMRVHAGLTLSTVSTFNGTRKLTTDMARVAKAIRARSTALEVDDTNTKVRRKTPFDLAAFEKQLSEAKVCVCLYVC